MNADKILTILCRYLKDTDNRLLARWNSMWIWSWNLSIITAHCFTGSSELTGQCEDKFILAD